ncbi:hypothetical protein M426DRAFT_321632 [Hypoxylon sp. CI-4A]|nr:hypothetical protein M426DRAFT_321632 [Hypoxylon sp. CI-4A]
MDDDIRNISRWRREHLGVEPIFCDAPSNPEDIVYLSPDAELDEDKMIEKRLRYEAHALRFLHGDSVRIHTASLRGPFDKDSGWKNPWSTKNSTTKKPPVESLQPAIKHRHLKNAEESTQLYGSTANTRPSTSGSTPGYLPSPSSNPELQPPNRLLETDAKIRIQSWTKEVSSETVVERDPFWVPAKSRRKRPAGEDWLKTKLSKRNRLSKLIFNTDAPDVTPTNPVPNSSVPIAATETSTYDRHRESAGRSFELTTPSSTTNNSGSEVSYARQTRTSLECETTPLQDRPTGRDELTTATHSRTQSPSTCTAVDDNMYDQPSPGEGQISGQVSKSSTVGHSNRPSEKSTSEDIQRGQDEADTDFESYLDRSFHYRTRSRKQEIDAEELDIPMIIAQSEPTKTRAPKSPVREDKVVATFVETKKQPQLLQVPSLEQTTKESVLVTKESIHIPIAPCKEVENAEGSKESVSSQPVIKEEVLNIGRVKHADDGLAISNKGIDPTAFAENNSPKGYSNSARRIDYMKIDTIINPPISQIAIEALRIEIEGARHDSLGAFQDDSCTSKALPKDEATQKVDVPDDYRASRTDLPKPEPLLDDGPTLIGDPMDFDINIPPRVLAKLPEAAEAHDLVQDYKSDTESISVMVPLSQVEWGLEEVGNNSTKEVDDVAEDKPNIPFAKIESHSEPDNPVQTPLPAAPEILERQSPWVFELPPGADLTVERIKSEPIDNEPSNFSYPFQHPFSSPLISHHTSPKIKPSQQSPWGSKLIESARLGLQGHHSSPPKSTTPVGTSPIIVLSQKPQSPWAQTDRAIISSSDYPPISSTPTITHQELPQSWPQSDIITTEPENQVSGYPAAPPATPPRALRPSARTPDLERSIKSFAMFNTPSPKRRPQNSIRQYPSSGVPGGILSGAAHSNPWASQRPNRRVSFASFPNEGDINTPPRRNATRAASPPPPPRAVVDLEDEDTGNNFQNHFDVMKQRTRGESVRPRFRPQLLPSSSQQKPMTPKVSAMADAFQQADAHLAVAHSDVMMEVAEEAAEEDVDQDMVDVEQSPWQKDTQGTDVVADVMGNLDEFLGSWDVEAELQKTKE